MKEIKLMEKRQIRYEISKDIFKKRISLKEGAISAFISQRQMRRDLETYKKIGKKGFVHGNTGKISNKAFNQELKDNILDLYEWKYNGCSVTLFKEYLEELENTHVSYGFLHNLMKS